MPDDPSAWRCVFSDQNLILAFFGALGGSVRALALRTSWREGARVMLIGSATAFGAGVLAPTLLKPYFGEVADGSTGALGTLGASCFLLGLIAVTLVERVIDKRNDGADDEQS